jgi:purine-binding chemotaxis protein CheW
MHTIGEGFDHPSAAKTRRNNERVAIREMESESRALTETAYDQGGLHKKEERKEKNLHLIVFRLGREWYGVEITEVRKIIKVNKITYLPSSRKPIAGVVNFRGNILSVTDLKPIFSLPPEGPTEKRRIIVVESKTLETGLLVDEVVESVEVPADKIELTLSTLPPEGAAYLKGQCTLGHRLVALISVEKVLQRGM